MRKCKMIINVSELKNCNEFVELDLMNPTKAKSKFDDFQKEREGNKFCIKFYISEALITDYVREVDFIDWLLDWAEKYLKNWAEEYLKSWDEEQINQFSYFVKNGYDWERATEIVENTENSK